MKATITATAKYLPQKTLSNQELEKMVDTSNEWILSRTGIENRHIVSDGEATSDMCSQIAKQLLEKSGKSAEDIDLILVATSTPDFLVVSTAALVQDKIGAKNAWGYDIVAACTGFVYAMETGAKFIESGSYNNVIVIGAGHAGVEAANISEKYGLKTALITKNISDLGKLSCNPSIGGVGKTHIASEVDILGGVICKIGDKSAIHYRVLNLSKGPAVWGVRAQIDRDLYSKHMQKYIKSSKIDVIEDEAINILEKNKKIV